MPRTKLPPVSRQVQRQEVYFFPKPWGKKPVRLAAVGWELCARDYRIDRAGFSGFGVEFVVAGLGRLQLDGNNHTLLPGSIFCYGPSTSHWIESSNDSPLEKFFIDLAGPDTGRYLRKLGVPAGAAFRAGAMDDIGLVFQMLVVEARSVEWVSHDLLLAHLQLALLKAAGTRLPTRLGESRGRSTLRQAMRKIDDHFRSYHSLGEIARASGIEESYLCRLFSQYAGTSPMKYLLGKKMQAASRELILENLAVKEIADRLGYSDPLHFSRLFKKHFGVSPTGFRSLPRNQRQPVVAG